jgi:hypothetical protein
MLESRKEYGIRYRNHGWTWSGVIPSREQELAMRSKTEGLTPYDYDLNVFKRELLNGDGEYEHMGPWYIHIYEYTGQTTEELGEPIELTAEEARVLIDDDPYFQDHEPDLWYGLQGFLFDKWDVMSDRLKYIFEGLPKYKEQVLF